MMTIDAYVRPTRASQVVLDVPLIPEVGVERPVVLPDLAVEPPLAQVVPEPQLQVLILLKVENLLRQLHAPDHVRAFGTLAAHHAPSLHVQGEQPIVGDVERTTPVQPVPHVVLRRGVGQAHVDSGQHAVGKELFSHVRARLHATVARVQRPGDLRRESRVRGEVSVRIVFAAPGSRKPRS